MYQCPNLIDEAGVTVTITSDTKPVSSTDTDLVAQNLLENLSTRMGNTRWCPVIDAV